MKNYLERSLTFTEYLALLDRLLAVGETTGPNQSKAMVGYGNLNRRRMERLSKTVELDDSVRSAAKRLSRKLIWLIITEGWCGDAAQNIPVIEKIAAESDNIETRYLLRDENPELIDAYLTDGKRSIPKLIAIDATTLEVIGTWGARPEAAQDLFRDMKKRGIDKPLILENMQRWYNADIGKSVQSEFEKLLKEWDRSASSAANGIT
ncbi:MAG: thioredoxin family protein [Acidobacteria bacterium]|nr:thioredoxin family protein [Acidobacteriota bacterium]